MKDRLTFFLLCLVMVIGGSCNRSEENNSSKFDRLSTIFGIVVNEEGSPVKGAIVNYSGHFVLTDINGTYSFKNVGTYSRHNMLTIKADNYFTATRSFSVGNSRAITLKSILLNKQFYYSFTAADGGKIVTPEKVELYFPPSSIVYESTEADYTGTVKVAVKYIDPTSPDLLFEMPGNLTALDENGGTRILTTYGMVMVELQSSLGEKLNMKPGSQADLLAEIPQAILPNAPEFIPFWHFDETTGYWKEEGQAKRVNGKYFAKVSHFSSWNYDSQKAGVLISGRIVNQNGIPLSGAEIRFRGADDLSGGHGYTDLDGTFSGIVAKDEVLNVSASAPSAQCGSTLYTGKAGPYSSDNITIPDIVVDVPTPKLMQFTATFKDCNDNPVKDGYLKIFNKNGFSYHLPIVNSTVSHSLVVCDSSSAYSIAAIDGISLKASDTIPLISPGINNLGAVSICDADADYLTLSCPEAGIHITFSDTIFASVHQSNKYLEASYSSYNDARGISFSFNDVYEDKFKKGVFNILTAVIKYKHQRYTLSKVHFSSVNITEAAQNIGEKNAGSYTIKAENFITGKEYIFTGKFRFTRIR